MQNEPKMPLSQQGRGNIDGYGATDNRMIAPTSKFVEPSSKFVEPSSKFVEPTRKFVEAIVACYEISNNRNRIDKYKTAVAQFYEARFTDDLDNTCKSAETIKANLNTLFEQHIKPAVSEQLQSASLIPQLEAVTHGILDSVIKRAELNAKINEDSPSKPGSDIHP